MARSAEPDATAPALAGGRAAAADPAPAPAAAERREGGAEPSGFRAVESGARLGRYEVLEAIGEGGMATVFRARDPELRRDVAIKVLFPHLSRRKDVVQRFQREARAAARLRHPAILQTYDVGGGDGGEPPYIVMELVNGTSLDEHVAQRGPLLSELVACAGVVVAEALAVAHQAGVIHRDLKPGNLLVCDDGRLLLADFGVARVERDESLATKTGAVLGTPAYMSPEQATGEEIDARSDVYSLGATLYHLATGAAPYAGSAMKVMSQLVTAGALVPPIQRRPAVGRPLSTAIVELMAQAAADRPAGAKEAADRLRGLSKGLGEAGGERAEAGGKQSGASDELAAYFRAPDAYLARVMPAVVANVVAEGAKARRAGKLAAAMAAADRASALAPEDAAVRALVEAVTSQQVSGRRWRQLAMVGAPVLVLAVGAAGAAGWRMSRGAAGRAGEPADARAEAAGGSTDGATDGARGSAAEEAPAETGAGSPSGAETPAPSPSPSPLPSPSRDETGSPSGLPSGSLAGSPSASRSRPGSGPPASASRVAPPSAGSNEATASPAAPTPAPAAAAPSRDGAADSAAAPVAAPASITFAMDAWCELSIDGAPHGRADRNRAISLPPGKHVAECTQGAGLGTWRGELDVASGETRRVAGELRMEVAVTVEVSGTAVTLDGKAYGNRERLSLRNGRHHVAVRGPSGELVSGWVSVPRVARCTLRDQPVLDCYP